MFSYILGIIYGFEFVVVVIVKIVVTFYKIDNITTNKVAIIYFLDNKNIDKKFSFGNFLFLFETFYFGL